MQYLKLFSEQFEKVLSASKDIHSVCKSELGIICGFDYIYSEELSFTTSSSLDKFFILNTA